MKFFKNLFNKQVSQPVEVTETVVRVPIAEMNARFDRSAGRWCSLPCSTSARQRWRCW